MACSFPVGLYEAGGSQKRIDIILGNRVGDTILSRWPVCREDPPVEVIAANRTRVVACAFFSKAQQVLVSLVYDLLTA